MLRDFEGLSGHLHAYKVDVAKAMLEMCHALGSRVLLACSSTSAHATGETDALVKDLQKLAMLAVPLGIRIAYEALVLGPARQRVPAGLGDRAGGRPRQPRPVPGLVPHPRRRQRASAALADIDPRKVFLVQLSDFMWQEARSRDERIDTARHFRVFPGEGVHSEQLAELVRALDEMGYRGDYSFEVFNDDYRTLPLPMVAERARRSVKWLTDQVSRRSLPPRRVAPR